MNVTWLGQAGLLFESDGLQVMIDPYLSDSVGQVNPRNHRRVPVKESLFDLTPDVMLFTHDHLDHFDPDTVSRFLAKTEKSMIVLCPSSVWGKARAYGGGHNYVLFDRGTVWTQGALRFTAVKAAHSDAFAIGVTIEALSTGKTYYVTGDTLYHRDLFADLPAQIDTVFLPVNGLGNNMNMTDAARLCAQIAPKHVVPMHCGLFDAIDMHAFDCPHRVIPQFYERVELEA